MPTIINGVGTWYCGKRRIHRVKSGCTHCGAFAEIESYDTTLCFVVFMVPVVPLSEKRILNSCPVCQRHQIVKLKDWESGKSAAFNAILEKLQAKPDDRETIQSALALATVYQDEQLFDKLADVLVGHRTEDAEIQAQLGAAYEYFSRWSDAEAAYGRSLAVEDSPDTRERLAVCMLKQIRPEEAAQHLQHVFTTNDPEKAWLIFWLVEGFMARGMHEEALKVMDVRDQMYPDLAKTKDYQKQRRTAEKNKTTGKSIKSVYLAESAKTGFREGSKLGFRWPKYVAAAVILGLLGLYLGNCIYRGQNRTVYLVNGWTRPYTVAVNGEAHLVQPGTHKKIDIPEGEVTVDWPDGGDGPQTVAIETGFFGRPFNRPVFVLNPDRLALLERQETVYAATPVDPDNPPEFRTGQLLQEFPDVDYEFEQFPHEIQAKEGARITKTRVGLVATSDPRIRVFQVMAYVPPERRTEYFKRVVQLDPNDAYTLAFMTSNMPAAEAIEFLRTGLAARPVRMEWHRAYQSLVEVAEPARDLRPDYRKLVEETKRSPDAVYLLARLESGPESDRLYTEAASANPPSGHACAGLAFRYLARGEFEAALPWATKAHEINPEDIVYRSRYFLALQASGKYAELLKATTPRTPTDTLVYLQERLTAFVATGELGAAEGEINRAATGRAFGNSEPPAAALQAQLRLGLELSLAMAQRDRARYLEIAAKLTGSNPFVVGLLRGDHKAAAGQPDNPESVDSARDWEMGAIRNGLLFLAGHKAKDAPFADESWKKLVDALGHGDRDARMLAAMANGQQPFDVQRARSAIMAPHIKRVVLSALARKFPNHIKDLDPLARKLDFERDETSLCLRTLTE